MSSRKDFSLPFDFNPNDLCFCGSRKQFASCCGSPHDTHTPPPGVYLKKGFLSASQCEKIVSFAESKGSKVDSTTLSRQSSAGVADQLDTEYRVCSKVELDEKQLLVDALMRKIYYSVIQKQLRLKIRTIPQTDLMCYSAGGYFQAHADSEFFDAAQGKWRRVADRDFSLLLYLNDDFEGGDVIFNRFNFRYRPCAGDLLVFPSHRVYTHEVEKITSGRRYVIVSWATVVRK